MPIELDDGPKPRKGIQLTDTEIPRRRASSGSERGPLLIPPGATHKPGTKVCKSCGRKVAAQPKNYYKHSCKCFYHKRTTTFIDVLQDEFLLKNWGKRNVAWGMGQRPDLQIAAASLKPDSHAEQTLEEKRELNDIAAEAGRYAGDMYKATIGSSLHRLTHTMDRGEKLGHVPARWSNDLKVYDKTIKSLGIEWVSIESFRVLDEWVKDISECDHKRAQYGGGCTCLGVAGTVDRIGWYQGRLCIFDIKTGSDFNKLGHAMQLACYAHMVPYQFPGDTRGSDVAPVDLNVGYIIYLPEGEGSCTVEPMNIEMGWRACQLAKLVWDVRDWNPVVHDEPHAIMWDMTMRATSLAALRQYYKVWKADGMLSPVIADALTKRAKILRRQGVTK